VQIRGKSDLPETEQTVNSTFSDLYTLIKAEGLKPPFILVGHSYGGVLIKHFAEKLKTKALGLVFVDASDENYKETMFSYRNAEQNEYWSEIVNRKGPDESVGPNREIRAFDGILRSAADLSQYCELPASSLVCDNLMRLDLVNRTSIFDEQKAPFDILSKDNLSWIKIHSDWKLKQPSVDIQIIEGCSHYIHKEKPEKVAGAIRKVAQELANTANGLETRSAPML
jgi:pimeloyl-ACP methyl ester carboxylesterase